MSILSAPKVPPPHAGEVEGDPGVVILFSSAEEVHQVLGLPAVANLQLPSYITGVVPLQQGATPNQSLTNLQQWLDSIASTLCQNNPLVTNNAGGRIAGLFHQMQCGEHQKFLQTLFMWATQCATHLPSPVSAGTVIISMEPGITMVHTPCGPFIS